MQVEAFCPEGADSRGFFITPEFVNSWEPSAMITNPIPSPTVPLRGWGAFAVISIWDETIRGFEAQRLLRNPDREVAYGNH